LGSLFACLTQGFQNFLQIKTLDRDFKKNEIAEGFLRFFGTELTPVESSDIFSRVKADHSQSLLAGK
jgi:hypothetical protein